MLKRIVAVVVGGLVDSVCWRPPTHWTTFVVSGKGYPLRIHHHRRDSGEFDLPTRRTKRLGVEP